MANITLKARVDTKELDAAIAKVHELVHLLFSAKACGREDKICSLYVEKSVKSLEQEIDRLRRQSPPEGEEEP